MQLIKNNPIEQFSTLFFAGIESWLEAGKVVSKALEADPDFAEKVNSKHPEIDLDTIYAFDRIGRKQLHPKLVISGTPGAAKLRRCPYTIQEKYLTNSVPLLVKTPKGWDTLQISVFNLTTAQAQQVFDSDGIRTEPQQRAYIEDKSARSVIQFDEPFRISGRKLIVMQPCQLTAKQLATVLSQMD